MKRTFQLGLAVLLCAAVTGCGGCGPVVVEAGGACEQMSDCANGLWCLGRVCQKAPVQPEHRDGGYDSGEDAAQDVGQDAGTDAGTGNDSDIGECQMGDVGPWISAMCPSPPDASGLTCDQVRGGIVVQYRDGCYGHIELGQVPNSTFAFIPDPPIDNLLVVMAYAVSDLPYGNGFMVVATVPLDRLQAGERTFSLGPSQPSVLYFVTAFPDPFNTVLGNTSYPGGYGTLTFTALDLVRCGSFTIEVTGFLPDDEEPSTPTGYQIIPSSTICGRMEDKPIPDVPDAGQDAGADGGGDAGLDAGEDGGADGGIVVQCGASPTGKGGDMCLVPAGPFWMGCNEAVDDECYDNEKPYHEVTVPAFRIDRYEVTAGEYMECVTAGGCTETDTNPFCTYRVSGKENHPINCVAWDQAKAYCAWTGKRLPTEAEWEKAARGTDGRKYPWGNDSLDCDRAVHSVSPCSNSGTATVGSKPLGVSPYGAEDMIGNVWEWVEDSRHDTYTGAPSDGSAWVTPTEASRVGRGGSWYGLYTYDLRASNRTGFVPTSKYFVIGFRCAGSQ